MVNEIDRARTALEIIPPNLPRDEWHEIGRAAIAAGLTIDDVDSWSATADNYKGRRDVEAAFRTIKPDGRTGAGTLFHIAKQYGLSDKGTRPSLPIAKPSPRPAMPVKQAARGNAAQVLEQCIPATPAEAYIYSKQGKPDGLKVYPASAPPLIIRGQNVAGYLVVPCWDGNTLQTLQFIPPEKGDKLNLPGASFGDGFFTVGEITERAYIVEGIGQAWAVNKATGAAAVVCFGAGRMARVAAVLRDKFPAAVLVIVPDKGKEEQAAKIAAAVAGQWIEMPADKPSNYDCSEFAQDFGADALANLLKRPQAAVGRLKHVSGFDAPALAVVDSRDGTATTRPLTEHGNALRLLDLYEEKLRYVHDVKSWLVWRDGSWVWDTGGAFVRATAGELAPKIYDEGAQFDMAQAQHFAKWARSSQSEQKIDAAVSLLSDQGRIRLSLAIIDADRSQ